ncbi:MAG: hypothetical protein JJ864_08670 [Rhizobiaceae bacterium]|nr:hypothetical protein [Rhizobiaceae bacterium]
MTRTVVEAKKAEYKAAEAALIEARSELDVARRAYHDAILDATGLRGHVVEHTETRGFGSRQKIVTRRFVVRWLGSWSDEYLRGPIVKKDGTIGERESQCRIENAKDCGPFEAAT